MSVPAFDPAFDVRLAPLAPFEPPYDDEHADSYADTVTPPLPLSVRRLRLVPTAPARSPGAEDDDVLFGPQRTASAQLPDAKVWGHQFVQALWESVDGRRGFGQLARFVSTALAGDIERRAAARARTAPARTPRPPACVRSVHVCMVDDGIAELTAVVRQGARTLAVAFRLEGTDGRWLCTALQM